MAVAAAVAVAAVADVAAVAVVEKVRKTCVKLRFWIKKLRFPQVFAPAATALRDPVRVPKARGPIAKEHEDPAVRTTCGSN